MTQETSELSRPTAAVSEAGVIGSKIRARALAASFGGDADLLRGYLLISPALLIAAVLLVVPFVGLLLLSFATQDYFTIDYHPTLDNYLTVLQPSDTPVRYLGIPFYFENPIFLILLVKSILIALISTVAVVVLAYPMAYFLAFQVTRARFLWLVIITLPFWTSYLLRIFSWKIILGYDGVINDALMTLGLIGEPLDFLLYSTTAVVVTLAHSWAAFAILPIYVSLAKIEPTLIEASMDLGDTAWKRFRRIILPLSMPGVTAACLLVFIPTVGDYATPTLVGGRQGMMIANMVQSQFGKANNAPLGAALSVISMIVVALLVIAFLRTLGRERVARDGG